MVQPRNFDPWWIAWIAPGVSSVRNEIAVV